MGHLAGVTLLSDHHRVSVKATPHAMGARIKRERERLNLSQSELGRDLGLESQSVSKWERGLARPKGETLVKLATKFGRSPQWILTGDEPAQAASTAAEFPNTAAWERLAALGEIERFIERGGTPEQVEHARRTPFRGTPRVRDYQRILEDMLLDIEADVPRELQEARRQNLEDGTVGGEHLIETPPRKRSR